MEDLLPENCEIDYIEIYTPMAKALAYWHIHALGFSPIACTPAGPNEYGITSYVLQSGEIRLVLTSVYPTMKNRQDSEVASFIARNYCGVKRVALRVSSVSRWFDKSIGNMGIPIKFPTTYKDDSGSVEEAAIKLYDQNELVFINRDPYKGVFKPGFVATAPDTRRQEPAFFQKIDHIASEVRVNESAYWTEYLKNAVGTMVMQSIGHSNENKTGMIMNISQTPGKNLTMVISEPDTTPQRIKIQTNIDTFGPGIHHLAFSVNDIVAVVNELERRKVEFTSIPDSYYDLLRSNEEFKDIDIDALQKNRIIIDKEGDSCLLQRFIMPISERPFFLYEIVQRVNGYAGFAVKNINALKKAEEMVASAL